jgi:hypothetical protein
MKIEEYREGLPVIVKDSPHRKGVTTGEVIPDGIGKQRVYKCRVEMPDNTEQIIALRRLDIRQGVKV